MIKFNVPCNLVVEPYMGKVMVSDVVDVIDYLQNKISSSDIAIFDEQFDKYSTPKTMREVRDLLCYTIYDWMLVEDAEEIVDEIISYVTLDDLISTEVVYDDEEDPYLECVADINVEELLWKAAKDLGYI